MGALSTFTIVRDVQAVFITAPICRLFFSLLTVVNGAEAAGRKSVHLVCIKAEALLPVFQGTLPHLVKVHSSVT